MVQCGLKFSQNHNCTISHFCDYICGAVYKMRFEVGIFFKFWVFSTRPKLIFPFVLVQVLNYRVIYLFFFFWVGFPNQHLLGLSIFFFFLN